MQMTILEMSYLNIRKISSLTISFEKNGEPVKNTFIMMASGTGKTTTMDLIKGIFDGAATHWVPEKVRSYRPLSSEISNGCFTITVKFDAKIYKYFLDLNYEVGVATISSSVPAEIGGGKGNKRLFPMSIKDLFTEKFVKRFVFDGEQATKVLDNKSNEAEEAIKYLYGLDEFDNMLIENEKILAEFQAKNEAGKGSDHQLKNNKTRKNEFEKIVRELKEKLGKSQNKIDLKSVEMKEIEDRINEINNNFTELSNEKNEIQGKLDHCNSEKELCISGIVANLRSPYLVSLEFSNRMIELGQNMTKLKLPKTISREFFKELSNATDCICGRGIGAKEKQEILKNAESYLGEDQQFVLNNIKSSLVNSSYSETVEEKYAELQELLIEENKLDTKLRNVKKKLESAGGEKVAVFNQQINALRKKLFEMQTDIEIIESRSDNDARLNERNNLKKAMAELKKFEEKIAAITQTNLSLKRKQKFEVYINQLIQLTNIQLKEDIIRKANEKIAKVITDDFIEIECIDQHIRLKQKGAASMGQTLSIAFCYIGTLFEDSELKFPFIIDSPVNSIDKEKRRAVAEIIPKIFNQMICFVMSAEVAGFAEKFYSRDDSQFITIESKDDSSVPSVNYEIEYFNNYQDELTEVI